MKTMRHLSGNVGGARRDKNEGEGAITASLSKESTPGTFMANHEGVKPGVYAASIAHS